jgi:hypothetical protein
MTALAGESALGVSTAPCNPGIISVGLTITVAVTSWRDAKYGRHQARGLTGALRYNTNEWLSAARPGTSRTIASAEGT